MSEQIDHHRPPGAGTASSPGALLARRIFWRGHGTGLDVVRAWTDTGPHEVDDVSGGWVAPGTGPGPDLPADSGEPVVAVCTRVGRGGRARGTMIGFGAPAAVAPVLASMPAGCAEFALLPRGTRSHVDEMTLHRLGFGSRGEWDWFYTTEAPAPLPGEDRVVALDTARVGRDGVVVEGADDDAVRACLADANPTTWALRELEAYRWFGVRAHPGAAPGAPLLSAIAAEGPAQTPGAQGVHLAALGTVPEARGQGLGSALLTGVIRRALARHPFVHLGMWADNDVARAIYVRHGLHVGMRVENLGRPA